MRSLKGNCFLKHLYWGLASSSPSLRYIEEKIGNVLIWIFPGCCWFFIIAKRNEWVKTHCELCVICNLPVGKISFYSRLQRSKLGHLLRKEGGGGWIPILIHESYQNARVWLCILINSRSCFFFIWNDSSFKLDLKFIGRKCEVVELPHVKLTVGGSSFFRTLAMHAHFHY